MDLEVAHMSFAHLLSPLICKGDEKCNLHFGLDTLAVCPANDWSSGPVLLSDLFFSYFPFFPQAGGTDVVAMSHLGSYEQGHDPVVGREKDKRSQSL